MWIYNLVIRCYAALIHLSAFRNSKAKQWVQGRKNWKHRLANQLLAIEQHPRIWMHCASYGEFEQGRPLLEAIRLRSPNHKIVLSFFSPSGYEAFKNWPGADVVCYLPFDSANNASTFVNLVKAEQVIFIKYEFWLNFLMELKRSKTSAFLVSAVFKPHHPFFRWYGGIFKDSLSAFTTIFVQDTSSLQLLQKAGIRNAVLGGDTRFDRVMQIKQDFEPLPLFEHFCHGHKVIVAGSTWANDEVFLLQAVKLYKGVQPKILLVPHEVDKKSITETLTRLKALELSYCLYSELQAGSMPPQSKWVEQVLVVDTIGLLSRLYHYADFAYVGGGFDSGIHNLLEPAVHLKPVLFGGKADYSKYNEALELIAIGGAQAVEQVDDLFVAMEKWLNLTEEKITLENNLRSYFEARTGSTQKVVDLLFGKV